MISCEIFWDILILRWQEKHNIFWRIQAQIAQLGLPLLHVELLLTSLPHPLFLVWGHTGRIAQVFQNVVDLHDHFFQFMEPLRNFGETERGLDAIRK